MSGSEGRWGVKARLNGVLRVYAAAWMVKALADESWRVCMKSKGTQTPENGIWMKRIFVLRAKMARWGEEVRSRYVEEVAGGWKKGETWEEEVRGEGRPGGGGWGKEETKAKTEITLTPHTRPSFSIQRRSFSGLPGGVPSSPE
jgi:hypothetical protein